MAIIVFAVYCAVTGYSPGELFRTENLNGRQIGKYVMMTLFFQQVSMICTIIMSNGLYSLGLEVSGLNYVIERTPSVYAADIISAVIRNTGIVITFTANAASSLKYSTTLGMDARALFAIWHIMAGIIILRS